MNVTGKVDPLTGLFDRSILKDFLHEFIQENPAGERTCGLLLLDVDNFKSINDAFGHGRGDQILIELGQRLQAHIRPSDYAIRYGGDEFILILPETDASQIEKIAERLLENIHQGAFEGTPTLHISVSMGGASYPADALSAENLFERADQRHYAAKRSGRGRFVGDDPPRVEGFLFNEHLRLVERDVEFERGHRFLEALPAKKRGVFLITGQTGVGKTRFLTDMGKLAQLLGFAILHIRGQVGLRTRMYGAVAEGLRAFPNFSNADILLPKLTRVLHQSILDKGQSGLLLAVDDLAEVDFASLQLIETLLASSEIPVVGLACVTEPDSYLRTLHFEVPLSEAVNLNPFSAKGVQIWLRALLQWEGPDTFLTWVHQSTRGLPKVILHNLEGLIHQGGLRNTASGWMLHDNYPHMIGATAQPIPARLPVILTSFIGRVREIQKLKDLIETRRLVNIVGSGGIGKTRLALQAARELSPHFGGEVVFVPLVAVNSPGQILPTIAQTLGLALSEAHDAFQQLQEMLGPRKVLMILDNFEHLSDGIGNLMRILDILPNIRIIVTSRERLYLPDEYLFELEGLPLPHETEQAYLNMEAYPAVQLFLQRAHRASAEFVADETQMPYIVRICQLVKGVPLGIELAAVWARTVSCQEIAEQIEQNLDFLANDAVYSQKQAGYRNMRAVFDYFWGLLSEPERWFVCDLSIFRGDFTQEAAQKVAGLSRFFLSALVDRAYLSTNTEGRYLLHPLLRQYTHEKLTAEPIREFQSLARYTAYYVEFLTHAISAEKDLPQKVRLQKLESEQHNLEVALEWSVLHAPETALQLTTLLAEHFWYSRGRLREGRVWLSRALSLPASAPCPARAKALYHAAVLANGESDYESACACLEEGLALWQEIGDQKELARTLNKLSSYTYNKGDHVEAFRLRQQALPLLHEVGDQSGLANAYAFLGVLATVEANFPEAQRFLEEAYQRAQAIQDEYQMGYSAVCLSQMYTCADNKVQALQWAEQSLLHYENSYNYVGMASILKDLGKIARLENHYDTAVKYYRQSLALCQKMNHLKGIAWICEGLAGVAAARDQMEEAAILLGATEHWLDNPHERDTLISLDKQIYSQLVEQIRCALGEEKYNTFFTRGENLNLEATLHLAQQISLLD